VTCRHCTITQKINASSTATLRFDKSDFLQLGAVNYLDEVVINSVSQKRLLYRGNIVSIKSEPNNQVLILLDNGVVVCQELCKISVSGCLVVGAGIVSVLKCKLRMTA